MASNTPPLEEVIKAFVRNGLADTYTAIPAVVITYEPALQRASVKPVVRGRQELPLLDRVLPDPLPQPIIPNVPVAWPGGTSGALTIPLLPGDPVTLVFAHRSTDEWRATGLPDVLPQDGRRHDIADAICIPGGHSFNPASGLSAPFLPAVIDAANLAVVLHALTKLQLGGTLAIDQVIKGTTFITAFSTWLTATKAFADVAANAGIPPIGTPALQVWAGNIVAAALTWSTATSTLTTALNGVLSIKVYTE